MSGYSWTLPSSSAGFGLPAQDQATATQRLFGRDIWLDVRAAAPEYVVTAAGDWALVEGREALKQSLIRRLITDPGEWATLPGYGVGAQQFVKARNTAAKRDELTERIRAQFSRDARVERVDSITITALASGDGLRVLVLVTPRGELQRGGSLSLDVEIA